MGPPKASSRCHQPRCRPASRSVSSRGHRRFTWPCDRTCLRGPSERPLTPRTDVLFFRCRGERRRTSDEPHPAAKPPIVRAALEFTIHRAILLPNSEEDVEMGFGTHAEGVNSSADPRTVHRAASDHAAPPSRRDPPASLPRRRSSPRARTFAFSRRRRASASIRVGRVWIVTLRISRSYSTRLHPLVLQCLQPTSRQTRSQWLHRLSHLHPSSNSPGTSIPYGRSA